MKHQFLLEIGLEEMPAHVVRPTMEQLKEKTIAYLAEHRLGYEHIDAFATPRRFGVLITGLDKGQEDETVKVKGPSKAIALNEDGSWSKAAEGFVRGQKMTTEDIFFETVNGVDYVHLEKFIPGKSAAEVLQGLSSVVMDLNFPVSMSWGSHLFTYIRPVHWVVALLDETVLPFQVFDVCSGNISRGHRFLGATVEITAPNTYVAQMKSVFVWVDPDKRKEEILRQINIYVEKNNWKVTLDEGLLEEVTQLVEYPTVFVGHFKEKYLTLPEPVLITTMKEHQRYFEIRDERGQLLPHFFAVRNGNDKHLDQVRLGNEKVLTARLEDAMFFYEEDLKLPIQTAVDKLKDVAFHEKLGSMAQKMARVTYLAELLAPYFCLTEQERVALNEVAQCYKFDLVTHMVDEFPELQGIMGEIYAKHQGRSTSVAQAIREHYLPKSSEDQLPQSNVGAALAIADRLDTLYSFFSVDLLPTGSNDPYALRRQAFGIVRILADREWQFPLARIQTQLIDHINQDLERYGVTLVAPGDIFREFLYARMKQYLMLQGVRGDIIEASLNADPEDLTQIFEVSRLLNEFSQEDTFRSTIEALTRVVQLAKKAEEAATPVDPKYFEQEAEQKLYDAMNQMMINQEQTIAQKLMNLMTLRELIHEYFDTTMVMVDEEAIRNNRLAMLSTLATYINDLMDVDALVVKD